LTTKFENVSVVLLDIEGTTTPISYVYETLFPYARKHLRPFLSLQAHNPDVLRAVAALEAERDADPSAGRAVDVRTYAESLMDRDAKSPALKSLQGLIWNVGYGSGVLRGQVFDDVPESLRRWRSQRIRTAIYSSGSVLAQQLIFSTTKFGDLTPLIDGFFDTGVGAKRDVASYRTIAGQLRCDARSVLFTSDVMPEIAAASAAGCQTALIVRPGNPPQSGVGATATIASLSDLELTGAG
jgi:enolase-phosphatase E1